MRVRHLMLSIMLLLAVTPALHAQTKTPHLTAQYFPETKNWLSKPFIEYWTTNGAIPTFGFPIEPMTEALNNDDGQLHATQVFERNRLEYHPQNQAPYTIQLGRLGDEVLLQQGRNWRDFPQGQPTPDCDFFPETNHTLCGKFKDYWHAHGLNLDAKAAISYDESVALFGLPLSEPLLETNANGDEVLTQWFERARFEYHPNNPAEYQVLLGLLGKERYGNGQSGIVAEVSGSIGMVFIDGDGGIDESNSGPFWEVAERWGLTITSAKMIIQGPNYSESALADFGGWYSMSTPISPDNTYLYSEKTTAMPPAGEFRMYYHIVGTCANGKPIWTNPYGYQELALTARATHTLDIPNINLGCDE